MVPAIARLAAAIDDLQVVYDVAPPAETMLEHVRELHRQLARLEAVFTRTVAAVHRSGAASVQGFASTKAFLRHTCHVSSGAAGAHIDAGLELAERPAVAAEFAAGAISFAHVKAVIDGLAPLPEQVQVDAEPVLLQAARDFDPARVHQAARRLRHIVDPDGQADVDHRHREDRWVDLAISYRGMGVLHGVLDPESAAVVRTALEALSTPAGDIDPRTPAQRRADALVELARNTLDSGRLPEVGGERPHLSVTVDYASLAGVSTIPAELSNGTQLGVDAARRLACDALITRIVTGDSASTPAEPARGRQPKAGQAEAGQAEAGQAEAGQAAEGQAAAVRPRAGQAAGALPSGFGVAIGAMALPAWPVAPPGSFGPPGYFDALPRHYLDALPPPLRGPSQILDVGRTSRTATLAIRKALAARDKGCVMPGCDRPPSRCEAHHVIHWADGGVTALHNMVLLCAFHHHYVHEHKWRIRVHPDGTVTVTPPPAQAA